jgi:hypothetical protein
VCLWNEIRRYSTGREGGIPRRAGGRGGVGGLSVSEKRAMSSWGHRWDQLSAAGAFSALLCLGCLIFKFLLSHSLHELDSDIRVAFCHGEPCLQLEPVSNEFRSASGHVDTSTLVMLCLAIRTGSALSTKSFSSFGHVMMKLLKSQIFYFFVGGRGGA